MDAESFFNLTFLFFMVLDAFGNVPLFATLLRDIPPKRQRYVIYREMLIALGVMLLFLVSGTKFLELIRIDLPALEIAGGLVLFIIAVRLLLPKPQTKTVGVSQEPLIVPLAIPAVAGPGILATISIQASRWQGDFWWVFFAIVLAWAFCVPILLLASFLQKLLGKKGLRAIEQLLGYLVTVLATKLIVEGCCLALLP